MSTRHDDYRLAQEAAQMLIDGNDIPQTSTENPLSALGWDLGDGAFTYEAGLTALVGRAVQLDRSRRNLVEVVAEALDEREARAAAQLVRDTDPDDDLWNNYLGPMLDSLQEDYTRIADEQLGGQP